MSGFDPSVGQVFFYAFIVAFVALCLVGVANALLDKILAHRERVARIKAGEHVE